jgi:hypothetical protein
MDSKQEHENEKSSDDEVVVGKPPSNAKLFLTLIRLKLQPIANYVLDGFPPVVAVIALIVAIIAVNDNKSNQAQLGKAVVKMDSMGANMQLASKGEMDKIKAAMAQEKLRYEEDQKKQNEQMAQIIRSVSKMQAKMKISPTLEEQMRQPVETSSVAPTAVKELVLSKAAPVVAAPAALVPAARAQVPAVKVQVPAAKVQVPVVTVPVPAVSTGSAKKFSPQVQTIKESIEQFNKK